MIKTKAEILEQIKTKFGEDSSDETLSFIEDVSDTLSDLESKSNGEQEWQKKYEDNDKMWREKYKARFFEADNSGASDPLDDGDENDSDNEPPKPLTFDELFKSKGE